MPADRSPAELREAFPEDWALVQRDIGALLEAGDPERLRAYVAALASPEPPAGLRAGLHGPDREGRLLVRRQLAADALRRLSVSAATGVTSGKLRLGLLSGTVLQKLLFEHDLVRKPVPLKRFRRVWPRVGQRDRLMPLVQAKGIYCFYSDKLIEALAERIAGRPALEIAAGDGTLSRFLTDAGVAITATDDHSWTQIDFPDAVLKQEAREALRRHRPQVVLCSWPPAGNPFERHVFTTPSVEEYVVIGTRHRAGAGDWAAYERQRDFEHVLDEELSSLVLPPEADPAVHVFRRR